MDKNISKKDKMLLAAALSIVVGVGYYALALQPLCDAVEVKKADKVQIDEKYNKAMADIQSLESRKLEVKELTGSISNKSQKFYPTIIQEKLIVELDKLIASSQIKVTSLAWNDKKVEAVEKFVQEKTEGVSSLQSIADDYKGKDSETSADNKSSSSTKSSTTSTKTGATCENITATLNVETSEDNLNKFISSLEDSGRKINITSMTLTPKNQGTVTGTIVLEFYGIPKMDNSDDSYYNWIEDKTMTYGKSQIFAEAAATGQPATATSANSFDIIGILKSSSSELPPFMIGKSDDSTFASYLSSTNSKIEEVEIELTEEDGKLYFAYKVGNQKYPATGASKGKEFTPKGSDIQIKLTSEVRVGSDDTSGIKLNVINNTTKKVNVKIVGDDKSNPRVPNPTTDGGTVNCIRE